MSARKGQRISTLGSRLTANTSVSLVLILLGLAAMCYVAAGRLGEDLRSNMGFVIKLEAGSGASAYDALKRSLLADNAVSTVNFTSAEDILRQESTALGEDIMSLLEANPYRAEFEVKVKPAAADPQTVDALVAAYSHAEGVEEIVAQTAVIEGVNNTLSRISLVMLIVAGALLIICIALLNNTVSLSIYSRRFVIHTMKLVGATPGFIRRPFLRAAACGGLIAGLCSSLIMFILRYYISSVDAVSAPLMPLETTVCICVGMTLLGVVLCTLTAAFATNRYLRADYDDMFQK